MPVRRRSPWIRGRTRRSPGSSAFEQRSTSSSDRPRREERQHRAGSGDALFVRRPESWVDAVTAACHVEERVLLDVLSDDDDRHGDIRGICSIAPEGARHGGAVVGAARTGGRRRRKSRSALFPAASSPTSAAAPTAGPGPRCERPEHEGERPAAGRRVRVTLPPHRKKVSGSGRRGRGRAAGTPKP